MYGLLQSAGLDSFAGDQLAQLMQQKVFAGRFLSLVDRLLTFQKPLTVQLGRTDSSQEFALDGFMLVTHMHRLLLKARDTVFPETNYLKQILEDVCDSLLSRFLDDYKSLSEKLRLTPDDMYHYESSTEVNLFLLCVYANFVDDGAFYSYEYRFTEAI